MNLDIAVDLLVHGSQDFLRVGCVASAPGQGEIIFDAGEFKGDGVKPPTVAVYPLTVQLAQEPPVEWTNVAAARRLFTDHDSIVSGETIKDVVLVWVGGRRQGTVAYRVAASLSVSDGPDSVTTWQAVAIIPVEATLHRSVRNFQQGPSGVAPGDR